MRVPSLMVPGQGLCPLQQTVPFEQCPGDQASSNRHYSWESSYHSPHSQGRHSTGAHFDIATYIFIVPG